MKRVVTITFEIDPSDYEGGEDSDSGTLDLAESILREGADWPSEQNEKVSLKLACDQESRDFKFY